MYSKLQLQIYGINTNHRLHVHVQGRCVVETRILVRADEPAGNFLKSWWKQLFVEHRLHMCLAAGTIAAFFSSQSVTFLFRVLR